ncbi:hypothetical protein DC366_18000 [Pelagivirga sediminicola]|uniref:Uncharacterized protein n=1 Tax=Pelagivirga sediminicola TaxID=2170575 RepID=A0A2T7G2L5_9RHOB|nr:hypothetical protein [Pelagivirga sediminicola]PVA08640.1 hypothetical protein DC366_18000 [Pelagivirga sediminicola]
MILLQAARAAKLPKIVQKSRCPTVWRLTFTFHWVLLQQEGLFVIVVLFQIKDRAHREVQTLQTQDRRMSP